MKCWSTYAGVWRSVLIITIGTILTFSVYAAYRAKTAVPLGETAGAQPHTVAPTNELEAELITILPDGFEPVEIVRPAGRFVLMFDNQSRLQPLEFRLARNGMPDIAEVHLGRKMDSTKVLNLQPGEYHVTEINHPDWSLKLIVTNH